MKKTWKGKYLCPKDLSLTDIPAGDKTVKKKMNLVINHWQIAVAQEKFNVPHPPTHNTQVNCLLFLMITVAFKGVASAAETLSTPQQTNPRYCYSYLLWETWKNTFGNPHGNSQKVRQDDPKYTQEWYSSWPFPCLPIICWFVYPLGQMVCVPPYWCFLSKALSLFCVVLIFETQGAKLL